MTREQALYNHLSRQCMMYGEGMKNKYSTACLKAAIKLECSRVDIIRAAMRGDKAAQQMADENGWIQVKTF